MVMKMNKEKFIDRLKEELNYSLDKCIIINDILESNFFISKKSKDKIIDEFINKLEVNNDEANRIYDISIKIVKEELKNKIKHPFKDCD